MVFFKQKQSTRLEWPIRPCGLQVAIEVCTVQMTRTREESRFLFFVACPFKTLEHDLLKV